MSQSFRAATPPMQAPSVKYGRDKLLAHTVVAERIVVGGRVITAETLDRGSGCSGCHSSGAPAAVATATAVSKTEELAGPAAVQAEVLVRHDPGEWKSAIERERAERNLQCNELQRALQEARDAAADVQPVTLERTAVKRGKKWFVGGEHVEASSLKISDGTQRRFTEIEYTVPEALQKLAAELDSLHAKQVKTGDGAEPLEH